MEEVVNFPWHKFQLWLRTGFCAGTILNKIVLASWPKNERPYPPQSTVEEIELLNMIREWAEKIGKEEYVILLDHLVVITPPNEYLELSSDEARTLWLALNEYGIAIESLHNVQSIIKSYLDQAPNNEEAIKNGMDVLWRSLGPALDPNIFRIQHELATRKPA